MSIWWMGGRRPRAAVGARDKLYIFIGGRLGERAPRSTAGWLCPVPLLFLLSDLVRYLILVLKQAVMRWEPAPPPLMNVRRINMRHRPLRAPRS